MRTVPTYSGEISPEKLGTTLMHEHVFIRTPDLQEAFPGFMGWDDEGAMQVARERLIKMKEHGVDTICDLTVPGLGRNVELVAKAIEGTGMQVIATTGYYTYTDFPFPLKFNGPGKLFDDSTDDLLRSLFRRDIEEGIQGTGIKAGLIKCCTDEPGVTEDIERLIRAVARVHQETDTPITTHTHAPSRRGLDQQRILREEGVDLSRVLIGHSNETTDIGYLEELIDAGSTIGFDRCGLTLTLDLESQADSLATLCERGYAERVVLSHDRHCYSDWFEEHKLEALQPQFHYQFIQDTMLDQLRERGVTEEQIDQMMVKNPARFFGASSKAESTESAAAQRA